MAISKKWEVGNRCPMCNENHNIEDCGFFYNIRWKNEVSYFITENDVMDVLK